jgi:hypothetical protein
MLEGRLGAVSTQLQSLKSGQAIADEPTTQQHQKWYNFIIFIIFLLLFLPKTGSYPTTT